MRIISTRRGEISIVIFLPFNHLFEAADLLASQYSCQYELFVTFVCFHSITLFISI